MQEELVRLERDLLKVPGVTSARVVGESLPTEIHLVADPRRPAKQIVRDVQSLASAGFGMPIDHRIVSVVQLRDRPEPPTAQVVATRAEDSDMFAKSQIDAATDTEPTAAGAAEPSPASEAAPTTSPEGAKAPALKLRTRPRVDRVIFAARADSGWVKVALKWPNGDTSEGVAAATATRESRARGAMSALLQALDPALKTMTASIDVDHVIVQRVGESDSVTVRALFNRNGSTEPVIGTALIRDDVATAGVNALLHAVNRKLEMALA